MSYSLLWGMCRNVPFLGLFSPLYNEVSTKDWKCWHRLKVSWTILPKSQVLVFILAVRFAISSFGVCYNVARKAPAHDKQQHGRFASEGPVGRVCLGRSSGLVMLRSNKTASKLKRHSQRESSEAKRNGYIPKGSCVNSQHPQGSW